MKNTNSILDEIVQRKRRDVAESKALYPVALLERSLFFATAPVSLRKYILRKDLNGIIAEFKRQSPSLGIINPHAEIGPVSLGYMRSGASALSILTDFPFFGGKNSDVEMARKINYCPILRKDFVIDEYQVIEAKSIGADAILLIAAILTRKEIKDLSSLAMSLGMEVLFEMHEEHEVDGFNSEFIAGVNNRSLRDFSVSLNRAETLIADLPSDAVKIAESGILTAEDAMQMRRLGFDGFLIGEQFMRNADPEKACAHFVSELRRLQRECNGVNNLVSEGVAI